MHNRHGHSRKGSYEEIPFQGRQKHVGADIDSDSDGEPEGLLRERRGSVSSSGSGAGANNAMWALGLLFAIFVLGIVAGILSNWVTGSGGGSGGHHHHLSHRDLNDICANVDSSICRETDHGEWTSFGADNRNSRNAKREVLITAKNAENLAVKWSVEVDADVSSTPSVAGGFVYFCTWDGYLYSLNEDTGDYHWWVYLPDVTAIPGQVCRTTPAIYGDRVVVGTQKEARILIFDIAAGGLILNILVDPHPYAIITSSPKIECGVIYVGTASSEEAQAALNPGYTCCNFIGGVYAFSVWDGSSYWPTWGTKMLPDNEGATNLYSGAAIWSHPLLIQETHTLVVTTGNAYTIPDSVQECLNTTGQADSGVCREAGDYTDSFVFLDSRTGVIKGHFNATGIDAWTVACIINPFALPNCPNNFGPDGDFGAGAMRYTACHHKDGKKICKKVVGAGQKTGVFWTLNEETMEVVWANAVGPGGTLGGISWGTAMDEQARRIFVSVINSNYDNYTLLNDTVACGGFWAALDMDSGKTLWMTPDPASSIGDACASEDRSLSGAIDASPPTVIGVGRDSVVVVGSMAGGQYALRARDGKILWSYPTASIYGGVSVHNGVIFAGEGYTNLGLGTAGTYFRAYAVSSSLV